MLESAKGTLLLSQLMARVPKVGSYMGHSVNKWAYVFENSFKRFIVCTELLKMV